mmetsp:Transcript_24360/g.75469  ORF Transcript_24360/g.75469 Transcript_24360/m.75469 type:complete len:274 (-) Transcript_24360:655-1476(-)
MNIQTATAVFSVEMRPSITRKRVFDASPFPPKRFQMPPALSCLADFDAARARCAARSSADARALCTCCRRCCRSDVVMTRSRSRRIGFGAGRFFLTFAATAATAADTSPSLSDDEPSPSSPALLLPPDEDAAPSLSSESAPPAAAAALSGTSSTSTTPSSSPLARADGLAGGCSSSPSPPSASAAAASSSSALRARSLSTGRSRSAGTFVGHRNAPGKVSSTTWCARWRIWNGKQNCAPRSIIAFISRAMFFVSSMPECSCPSNFKPSSLSMA